MHSDSEPTDRVRDETGRSPTAGRPLASGAHWSVDFWVDDVDRVLAQATEQGGGVVVAPYAVPLLRQAVVADPNGVAFSVSQLERA